MQNQIVTIWIDLYYYKIIWLHSLKGLIGSTDIYQKHLKLWGILHKIYEKIYIILTVKDEFSGLSGWIKRESH